MGVTAVETIDVDEETDVSHDEQIARVLALEEYMSRQEPPASKTVTPSTSSTATASASSKMKLNIHYKTPLKSFVPQLHLGGVTKLPMRC